MADTENPDVVQEVVVPTVDEVSNEQDPPLSPEEALSPQQPLEAETDKDQNFKAIRESNARLQVQLDDERSKREHLQQAVEEKFAAQLAPQAEEEDELADVSDDDWTTRKHVEKLAARQAKTIVKQMLAEDRQARAQQELPDRLKAQHQDFESVVTKENVEYLKANKPHIAASLAAMKDPYAQALAAYDTVRAFCPTSQMKEGEDRMNKNAGKPGTLGSAQAPSPLTEAKSMERGLSPEMKRKYQQEMISSMRGG